MRFFPILPRIMLTILAFVFENKNRTNSRIYHLNLRLNDLETPVFRLQITRCKSMAYARFQEAVHGLEVSENSQEFGAQFLAFSL
jgi:hypothetical protein